MHPRSATHLLVVAALLSTGALAQDDALPNEITAVRPTANGPVPESGFLFVEVTEPLLRATVVERPDIAAVVSEIASGAPGVGVFQVELVGARAGDAFDVALSSRNTSVVVPVTVDARHALPSAPGAPSVTLRASPTQDSPFVAAPPAVVVDVSVPFDDQTGLVVLESARDGEPFAFATARVPREGVGIALVDDGGPVDTLCVRARVVDLGGAESDPSLATCITVTAAGGCSASGAAPVGWFALAVIFSVGARRRRLLA
jgi:uncharacterized protein (TIGR03382 family)